MFSYKLEITRFILTLELAGNTGRRNSASSMVDVLSRRQLLQNHLMLKLAMIKTKMFEHGEIHD